MTVVYQGKCSHCMRVGVAVPLSGTVSRLRQAVAQETKIPSQQVLFIRQFIFLGLRITVSELDGDVFSEP